MAPRHLSFRLHPARRRFQQSPSLVVVILTAIVIRRTRLSTVGDRAFPTPRSICCLTSPRLQRLLFSGIASKPFPVGVASYGALGNVPPRLPTTTSLFSVHFGVHLAAKTLCSLQGQLVQMSTTHSSFDQYCISHKTISHRAAAAPGTEVHRECPMTYFSSFALLATNPGDATVLSHLFLVSVQKWHTLLYALKCVVTEVCLVFNCCF